MRLADGLNLILSFAGAPVIAPAVEQQAREFLHQLLAAGLTEAQRAAAVCALRGVGDAGSAALLAALPPFTKQWAGLERAAAEQIGQRQRRVRSPGRRAAKTPRDTVPENHRPGERPA